MTKANYFAVIVGVGVLMPSIHDAMAQAAPACTSVATSPFLGPATNWQWHLGAGVNTPGGSTAQLQQDASGNITGTYFLNSESGAACVGLQYSVSGTYQGNGNFVLNMTNPVPPAGCAAEIVFQGTLSAPGCDQAPISFTNNIGQSGSTTISHGCYIPGETKPSLLQWGFKGNPPTVATFQQTFTPTVSDGGPSVIDWGGRRIYEVSPPNTGSDSCYYPNTFGVVKNEAVTGGDLYIISGGSYKDDIGASTDLVLFYRGNLPGTINRAPCGLQVVQDTWMACQGPPSDPDQVFARNADSYGIGTTAVTAVRAGSGATTFWSPAVSAANAVVRYLLKKRTN